MTYSGELAAPRLQLRIERCVVVAISVAGIVAGVATILLIWHTRTGSSMPVRVTETMELVSSVILLAVSFLIGWRAGDHAPNLSIGLALAFSYGSGTVPTLLETLRASTRVSSAADFLFFILGAGFYIRASQLFPRKLHPHDIVSSRHSWEGTAPLRAFLIFFLHPAAVWLFVISVTLLGTLTGNPDVEEAVRLLIVLTGLIYFYIMYRVGDPTTRRKVLWFLEVAVAALVIGVLGEAVHAALHGNGTPALRVTLFVLIQFVNMFAQVICICAAVLYAGAISPALVIRKTFVYGVTAALLLFAYATVEAYFVNLLVEEAGISDRFAGALLGTIVGLAFHPIRKRMEHLLQFRISRNASTIARTIPVSVRHQSASSPDNPTLR